MLINFDVGSTYLDVVVGGDSYSYVQSLKVIDENGQELKNTVVYYEGLGMRSLRQVKVELCNGGSNCGTELVVSRLRKPFSPLSSCSQSFKVTTLLDYAVSTATRDVS